jgi:hypothetical protein
MPTFNYFVGHFRQHTSPSAVLQGRVAISQMHASLQVLCFAHPFTGFLFHIASY